MPMIRPSSDLRNKYNEISEFCHQYQESVFITKNGTGDLVVMTNAQCEQLCGKSALYRLFDAGLTETRAGHGRPASDVKSVLLPERYCIPFGAAVKAISPDFFIRLYVFSILFYLAF